MQSHLVWVKLCESIPYHREVGCRLSWSCRRRWNRADDELHLEEGHGGKRPKKQSGLINGT